MKLHLFCLKVISYQALCIRDASNTCIDGRRASLCGFCVFQDYSIDEEAALQAALALSLAENWRQSHRHHPLTLSSSSTFTALLLLLLLHGSEGITQTYLTQPGTHTLSTENHITTSSCLQMWRWPRSRFTPKDVCPVVAEQIVFYATEQKQYGNVIFALFGCEERKLLVHLERI